MVMMAYVIILGLFWLYQSNKPKKNSSDLSASHYLGTAKWSVLLILRVLIVFSWIMLQLNTEVSPYITGALFILLISPSLVSLLTAQVGLVKTSYFVGRLSYWVFKRNPHAGGLFRGLTAVHRLKNETKKREALLWLKNRFLNHRGRVYSGDIVVYTIIDCQLNHPNDLEHLANQLKKLIGIGKESIPKAISRYAFCCAAAPSIANDDWRELSRVAFQWDTPAKNRLAKFVKEFSGATIFNEEGYSKLKVVYLRIFCLHVSVFFSLPKRYEVFSAKQQAEKTLSYDISGMTVTQSLSSEQIAKFREILMNDAQKEKWTARAQALGSWQPDISWEKIEQSITAQLASKAKSKYATEHKSDDYYKEIDRHCKSLVYIGRSIDFRIQSKDLGSGAQNFLEWKKVRQILEALESDPQAHLSAFISIENTVWKWIADLWNIKKEHCLVHYICKYCIPLAEQTGNTEFCRVMTDLTDGQYA